jgi:anti-sigma regulatory factor (Ser/Thr protein kinase)
MDEHQHSKFLLPDRTYQGLVRSELRKLSELAGFTGHRLGEAEIIIAEITSNLVKHTEKGGEILARVFKTPVPGIEFVAVDRGPGMNKPAKMLEDGSSTSNTLGQGLGAISRLSGVFDLYSLPGWGTVLFSRIYLNKNAVLPQSRIEINAINVCKTNETLCGDQWWAESDGKKCRLAMIDGLGHGIFANRAAKDAVDAFRLGPQPAPVDQLRALHERLKKTRGAVITVAYLDMINQQLRYSGVGNITMKIVSSSSSKGCLSYNGIVGHIMPATLNNHSLQIDRRSDLIVMHSDGLSARWDLQKYPGIFQHHGMTICGVLYKDFDRNNDDSTVLVAKFDK